ncbi:MAG: hypothetical protein MJ215_05370 [Spirochaetia bacterium]|nr:hypothetical protein [Spirochaetia bacterium]
MSSAEKWGKFFLDASNPGKRRELNTLAEENPGIKKAVEILIEISQEERERAYALSREKGYNDYWSGMLGAEQRGLQQGRQEGIQQGMKLGMVQVARQMKAKGTVPLEEISEFTGLSPEQIQAL